MLEQFKRVDFGEWALLAGAVSIILLTAVFLTISIRCFILPKARLDRLSSLPLDDPSAADPPAADPPAAPSNDPTTEPPASPASDPTVEPPASPSNHPTTKPS